MAGADFTRAVQPTGLTLSWITSRGSGLRRIERDVRTQFLYQQLAKLLAAIKS
jgi:hypothetical protein